MTHLCRQLCRQELKFIDGGASKKLSLWASRALLKPEGLWGQPVCNDLTSGSLDAVEDTVVRDRPTSSHPIPGDWKDLCRRQAACLANGCTRRGNMSFGTAVGQDPHFGDMCFGFVACACGLWHTGHKRVLRACGICAAAFFVTEELLRRSSDGEVGPGCKVKPGGGG